MAGGVGNSAGSLTSANLGRSARALAQTEFGGHPAFNGTHPALVRAAQQLRAHLGGGIGSQAHVADPQMGGHVASPEDLQDAGQALAQSMFGPGHTVAGAPGMGGHDPAIEHALTQAGAALRGPGQGLYRAAQQLRAANQTGEFAVHGPQDAGTQMAVERGLEAGGDALHGPAGVDPGYAAALDGLARAQDWAARLERLRSLSPDHPVARLVSKLAL